MAWATQDSFAGIGINVLGEGRSRQSRAKVSVREIPGGDVVVINNGGLGARRRQYTLYVPDEETLGQLEDLCGATGDFVYWGGSFRGVLEELDASDWWTGGQQRVRASFVVIGQVPAVPAEDMPLASFVTGATGPLVELDANSSTAPDGALDVVNIEWGDGQTSTITGPYLIGEIPTAFHTYATAGTKIVTISVQRNGVLSADYSAAVEVVGPTAVFTATVDGLEVTLDFNDSTSPDDLIDEVNVEWGDGATNTYNVGAPWAVGAIPTRSHTYAAPSAAGEYVITVSVERSSLLSPDYSLLVPVEGP